MNIQLSDVTLHIDEALNIERRSQIENVLRAIDGVVSVSNHEQRPHLAVVEYNPEMASAELILGRVREEGVHVQMIGL
jgi:hypothetical protein